MARGRSGSPGRRSDVEMDAKSSRSITRSPSPSAKKDGAAKVVIITNLTRNICEAHIHTIFGFYGTISKVDIPVYPKSGQSKGKAALEYELPESAEKAVDHMDGGYLDGQTVKVELSNLPIRTPRARSRSPARYGRKNGRSPRRTSRSFSRSRSRSRSPRGYRRRIPPPREPFRGRGAYRGGRGRDFRGGAGGRRRYSRSISSRSRSRSRSPYRRRRRSPSYSRGGYSRRGARSRSMSVRSSRSRSRSRSRSPRSRSYSSYSRSRSRTRSRSRSLKRRRSRDDIRDSRSRSRSPRRSPSPTRD
ncbi:hypothetical protein DL96DRAFT_962995 [Flagelloscypha sp. PMI_526]|nr:hypothetical protein DL96DRAFT_962995 [Flagelloscypha sp. PMI_526]